MVSFNKKRHCLNCSCLAATFLHSLPNIATNKKKNIHLVYLYVCCNIIYLIVEFSATTYFFYFILCCERFNTSVVLLLFKDVSNNLLNKTSTVTSNKDDSNREKTRHTNNVTIKYNFLLRCL